MNAAVRRGAGVLLVLAGIAMLVLPGPGLLCLYAGLTLAAPRLSARLRARLAGRLFDRPVFRLESWRRYGLRAGCTTRRWPECLSGASALDRPAERESLSRVLAQAGVDSGTSSFVYLQQVHGNRVARLWAPETAARPGEWTRLAQTDGIVTDVSGLVLLVLTADCLPVFLLVEDGGRARAAGLVHAGWRGTRLGIVPEAVRALCGRTGLGPEKVRAVFGPHIGGCHYEVGPEFSGYFPASSLRLREGRLRLDLAAETRRQLEACGVRRSRVRDLAVCTAEEISHFHSYRVEGERAGRTVSFVRFS